MKLTRIIAILQALADTQRNMPVPLTDEEHTALRDAARLLNRGCACCSRYISGYNA